MNKNEVIKKIKIKYKTIENFRKELEAIRNKPVSRSAIYKAIDGNPKLKKLKKIIMLEL